MFSFGIVAGLLGLDITEPPLSDWIKRTAAVTQVASGAAMLARNIPGPLTELFRWTGFLTQESEAISVTVIEPQPDTYGATSTQSSTGRRL